MEESSCRRRAWLGGVAAAALWLVLPVQAASRLSVTAASVESAGIEAQHVELSLSRPGFADPGAQFRAARIEGVDALGLVTDVRFACPVLSVSGDRLACDRGRLSGRFGALGPQDTPFRFALDPDSNLRVRAAALSIAGGLVSADAGLQGDHWTVQASFDQVQLGALLALPPARERLPEGMAVAGQLSGSLTAAGRGALPQTAQLGLQLVGVDFSDQAGALAGEKLAVDLRGELRRDGSHWILNGTLDAGSGQAYVEPVFLDLGKHPVNLVVSGRMPGDAARLSVDHFELRQAGVGEVTGSAALDLQGETLVARARTRLTSVDLAGALPLYAGPLLISTQFADLEAAGTITGELDIDAGLPSRVELDIDDVTLDSTTGALSVVGLAGRVSWFDELQRNELAPQVDSAVFKSRLEWRSAGLWGIEFGAASIPFTSTGRHFRLLDPVLLPVFDGGLVIETLRIRHAGTPQMYVRFDAELQPVSVALLGRALGWPEFSGTVAGRIPALELKDGLASFGGNLEAQVFDGTITMRGLRLRDPLGAHPQLFADIDVDRLDLERVTGTFEFGMITGRLSGRVEALEMFDWMPVSFNARFYTTPGDRTPHRISQRAVSNLSSVGGGSGGSVAAALQGGFLQFFDSFGYDRLGLSCRLANDVCAMDGVGKAPTGYYIVKGSGLPRIDVIGNQQRVAWTRLVRQLAAITQSSGPVVE